MQTDLNDLEKPASADAGIPARSFVEQTTYTPGSLRGQVDVFFDYGTKVWLAVNNMTREIQPLPAPHLAWAVDIDDETPTLVEVSLHEH